MSARFAVSTRIAPPRLVAAAAPSSTRRLYLRRNAIRQPRQPSSRVLSGARAKFAPSAATSKASKLAQLSSDETPCEGARRWRGLVVVARAALSDADDILDVGARDETVEEVQRKRGACYGCGVALQTDFPEVSGYVPLDEYETKRHHRQLHGMMLCSRCSDLSHGRMSKGLITPAELRDQLTHLREKKVLVVKVVDATDFHGSFLNKVRDIVGANPILLVLTKVDLLPRGTDLDALKAWVETEVTGKRKLTLAGVVCVSSRKGVGMREAVGAMFSNRKGRDVYVLGSANVGKSTFIRAALKSMREQGNFYVPGKRLPTASAMPGTTLGVIPLKAFEGNGVLYDTPGVFLHHRMNSILDGDDIKRFKLGATLVRYVPKPRVVGEDQDRETFAGLSLLWGPLIRVDVTTATANAGLTFYGPKGMRVTVVETASLPDPEAEYAAAVEAEAQRKLAGLAGLVSEEEEEEGAGGSAGAAVELAPSAAAALAAYQESESASPIASPYKPSAANAGYFDRQRPRDGEVEGAESEEEGAVANGAFVQRLVKEVHFKSPEGDAYGPLHDLCVSGMGGWVRVSRESRRGDCEAGVKVWGPRGLEVFIRAPMPTAL